MASGLSDEEFQRLQEQLFELKNRNYELEALCKRQQSALDAKAKEAESPDFGTKLANNVAKGIPSLLRTSKPSTQQEAATDALLRRKLTQQEEEFRLQNSMLVDECQRLSIVNEDLERKLLMALQQNSEGIDGAGRRRVSSASTGTDEFKSVTHSIDAPSPDEDVHEKHRTDNEEALKATVENLKQELERLRASAQQAAHVTGSAEDAAKAALAAANERLHKSEQRYTELAKDKEKQFHDFRKAMDDLTKRKDAEIEKHLTEQASLRARLTAAYDEIAIVRAERESVGAELHRIAAGEERAADARGELEIRLAEAQSANDSMAAQLEDARKDVRAMHAKMDEAEKIAEKRKALVDEMAQHLERAKQEHCSELLGLEEAATARERRLVAELDAEKAKTETLPRLSATIEKLTKELEGLLARKDELQTRTKELETQLEISTIQHEEALTNAANEWEERTRLEVEQVRAELELVVGELAQTRNEKASLEQHVDSLKQDVKDKLEELKLIERKHTAMVRDFKRQAQAEKKRADRLQEKVVELRLQETRTDRKSQSPGSGDFDESKFLKVHNVDNSDARSVSSWSMVSGKENGPGRDSVCATDTATLDGDDDDLVLKIAELQREKWTLQERITLLEEANAVLVGEVAAKSAIVDRQLRSVSISPSSSSTFTTSAAAGAGQHAHLPLGVKKVVDVVKIAAADLSAGAAGADMREMNRKLQLMLEETLTKNMHLSRDLEILSNEVQRLSSTTQQPSSTDAQTHVPKVK